MDMLDEASYVELSTELIMAFDLQIGVKGCARCDRGLCKDFTKQRVNVYQFECFHCVATHFPSAQSPMRQNPYPA